MKVKQLVNGESRLSEIIRFGMVGGVATVIQYITYLVFLQYVFNGQRAVVATIISYAISFVVNFFLSSYFTFHSRPNANKGIGFTLSHMINLGLQTGLVAIFKGFMNPNYALLPALAICIPVNYLMVRFAFTSKIFKSKKERAEIENEQSN